jgi:hypothetical protein
MDPVRQKQLSAVDHSVGPTVGRATDARNAFKVHFNGLTAAVATITEPAGLFALNVYCSTTLWNIC